MSIRGDIIRTPGTESNVKEIYDKCAELSADPANIVFNQFAEFGNHLVHYLCTGTALGDVFERLAASEPGLRLGAFVSASGSAGTLGAGDCLKERSAPRSSPSRRSSARPCSTNGFGEHNIQGIGDKHIPLIHNVMNTDIVAGDLRPRDRCAWRCCSRTEAGVAYLPAGAAFPRTCSGRCRRFGLSSICNILAAVKTAKYLELGPDDVVMTVATDGAAMYRSEREHIAARDFPGGFDALAAAETFGRWLLGARTDHLLRDRREDRDSHLQPRLLHLGGAAGGLDRGLHRPPRPGVLGSGCAASSTSWDALITEFNARTGLAAAV